MLILTQLYLISDVDTIIEEANVKCLFDLSSQLIMDNDMVCITMWLICVLCMCSYTMCMYVCICICVYASMCVL